MATPLPPEARLMNDCPTDGITALSYLGTQSLVACTSWDGTMRIYDTISMTQQLVKNMDCGPLLSLAVVAGDNDDSNTVYTGGMDGSIRKLQLTESNNSVLIGKHESTTNDSNPACSCLSIVGDDNNDGSMIASAGWHKKVHIWDARSNTQNSILVIDLPGKAFAMDVDPTNKDLLIVATSNRRICCIDIRKNELLFNRESSLKYQTRCIKFFPDGNAITLGSIEGRAAIEYLDDVIPTKKSNGKKKFAFKCHRQGDLVYPVNTIAFHPIYGTFATGGCDGTVVTWDGLNKKKLTTLPKFPTSISALAYNHDGSELAIASSYTFEEGEREHPKDEIYIRPMLESECRPKSK